jgi:uncharacterized protein YjbJ (UPF0337 family)
MSTDRIAAPAQQVKGSVKEAIGKLTGDTATEAQGAAEKVAAEDKSVGPPPDKRRCEVSKP